MVKSLDVPGTFIERWEGIVMALWILFYFTTFVNTYFFSSEIVKNVLSLKDIKISSLLIMPVIYVVALYPGNLAQLYDLQLRAIPMLLVTAFVFVVLPVLILLVGNRKGRGKSTNEI